MRRTKRVGRNWRLAIGVMLALFALLPTGAIARSHSLRIKGARALRLEEGVKSTSVAIGPDGNPWFGLAFVNGKVPAIAHVEGGELSFVPVGSTTDYSTTDSLRFDTQGNLWFIRNVGIGDGAIMRRDREGALSEIDLPGDDAADALTIGSEGNLWFGRFEYGGEHGIGRATPTGSVTEFPLESGVSSSTVGPDGAVWFAEPEAGAIGRITATGDVTNFRLGKAVEPREIVSGPDGSIWFTENGRHRRHKGWKNRIGRLKVDGEVTQFPIGFGYETEALTVDPRGFVWFTTEAGEISSISPSGSVGARGCVGYCHGLLRGVAVAPSGALWLAVGTPYCRGCGGGADLIAANEGTEVLKVPPGSLAPPPL